MVAIELVVLAALLGVAAHLGYFIRGEHLKKAPTLFLILIVGPTLLTSVLSRFNHATWTHNFYLVALLFGSFLTSMTTSILSYRLFFHPLKAYNGPVGMRMSKLYHGLANVRGENTYEILDKLHNQYGDYVRTGPNELSIIDSEIIEAVYGTHSKCIKTQWYDVNLPMTTLHQMRDRGLHDRRRKTGWDKAFSTSSLRAYDNRVIGFADKLKYQLDSFSGKPVDATKWFHYYGYDLMGSLGFGRSFNTLETGESHFAIDVIGQGQAVLGVSGGTPWLTHILVNIPSAINPITKLLKYSEDCIKQRKSAEPTNSDIISHLIKEESFFNDDELDRLLLVGDSRLIIVAGSDTTSAALAHAFFYLAQDKSVMKKLREELAQNHIRDDDSFSVPALQHLHYMNAIINEALRLHPPVPGGVFRQTPPEGLQVGDRFIPGNVNLLTPHYSLQRSSKNFVDPNSFIPERWTERPELILNKNAFLPFSTGPYGCIGKQLAYSEMRTVIAKLVLSFEVSMAASETGHDLFHKGRDMFTLIPGSLNLCFERRKQMVAI